jgi:hypothetical protein
LLFYIREEGWLGYVTLRLGLWVIRPYWFFFL